MNIIFLGKFFPQTILQTIKEDSKGKIGFSNHNFEMSIIHGLCKQEEINLQCLSIPCVFSYPYHNRKFITKPESYDYLNTHIYSVGFCNLPLLKEKWAVWSCARQLKKIAETFEGDDVHVIINTPDSRLMEAFNKARNISHKRFFQTVIIPDIPAMVTSMDKQNPIKAYMLHKAQKRAMEQTANSDGLILLTEAMMDFFPCSVKHIVMEGIVDLDTIDIEYQQEKEKKIILYTGTLRQLFGVRSLVDAFCRLPDNDVELWICGSGDSKEYITNAALKDGRIKFYGLVDSKKSLELQHRATILVNPRTSDGEYTKYSFPSKTVEYLLAGKSVIANRLPGIPEEYYDYIYTPNNESVEALTQCLHHVLHLDDSERRERAVAGRSFIIEKKNSIVQTRRIIEFLETYEQA